MDPMQNQLCRVCDEPAAGFHFGAFTCEGCKSFFGRTCNNQSVIGECKNNYRCVVDKKNRTSCKACRLRKCLMVGMSKSGSRYGRRSNWFKIHCLMQQGPGSVSSDPPAKPPPHAPSWLGRKDDSASEARDSSFGSSSRSPSPLDTSLESSGRPKKCAVSPADQRDSLSPRQSPLSSLYSPLSLMAANPAFPFYKLSPLFTSPPSPLLAPCHPLLLSLAAAGAPRSHLDLLAEHRQLLAKFGAARTALAAGDGGGEEEKEEERSQGEAPIDLSIKLTTASSLPTPSSPLSSAPDDEGIEVDIVEKSDNNSNILNSSSALDLTVSS